ncbi:MAG TPA: 16S rRNA (guanine(527)-N(7))-methyltransferase RsmG [Mycobacteriales bacterium]|nr:16S rRNA (guanine(527)-N(7))-methyltransferase RsmG [Mycobacteriales bacterium]
MPTDAQEFFGSRVGLAQRYVEFLVDAGVRRGVIGPREGTRIWSRHLLNCAAGAAVVPQGARVLDVGSGAGLPGIPLALARPDVLVDLLEPLTRRTAFLADALTLLSVDGVAVVRGRAADHAAMAGASYDVVTARAVTDLGTLHSWARRLLRPGGLLVAYKGAHAEAELAAARPRLGGATAYVKEIVHGVHTMATVVVIASDP